MNCDEFLKGQRDCMKGDPPKSGMSESYYRGYATQYEYEQIQNEIEVCYEQHRTVG